MVGEARKLVAKQLGRVRMRLFLQIALQSLLLAWAIGLFVTTAWFLARPFVLPELDETARWLVPTSILAVATLGGAVLAWLRRPNLMTASLALDDKFVLKERVTTFLTLSDAQLQTPAGQALVNDVVSHLTHLRISGEFPVQIPMQQMLVPAGALVLALAACFVDPFLGGWRTQWLAKMDEPVRLPRDIKEIEQKLDNLKKVVNEQNKEENLTKSDKLKEMEKEFEKLINQPLDLKNEEKVRERIEEFRKLEDNMKKQLDTAREKAEKTDALKKLFEKLNVDKDKLKEGPAKDFEDALMKGNLDKARNALEKMVKDLKNDKLSKEDQQKLQDQLKELQNKMKDLADKQDDLMKQLKKSVDEGKISPEQMKREIDALKELKEFGDIIGDAKDALEKGGNMEAAEKLEKFQKGLDDIQLTEDEIRDILRDQREIDDALRLLGRGDGEGDDDGEDGDGMGGGGKPGRRRPISPNDPNSKIVNQRQQAEIDAKGIQRVTGYARGGNFNKIPAKSVEGAFRQAVQEAPEALDRQRIPDDAADIARRYFEKLGSQK